MQDTRAALEIDAALQAKGPELMSGLLQWRQLAMTFRLWDPQARGCVNRAAITAVLEFYYRRGCAPDAQPSPPNRTIAVPRPMCLWQGPEA